MDFAPEVSSDDVARLRDRLADARWPSSETAPDQGLALDRVRSLAEHWRDGYDWDRYRERLTALPQVRTEIDGLATHAIHVPSSRPDAVPLLLAHGWPSTCFEFDAVVPLLADAFHVVVPSLPGYGFSGIPTEAGWGVERTADSWVALMAELGYDRFVAHGGDWGAIIATELAIRQPERLLGLHLTMPTAKVDREDLSDRERGYRRTGFGYAQLQMTRPQTLGYGLEDSPVGLLAWIGEKLEAWCGRDDAGRPLLSDDAILDVVTTYWLTRTATSSARMYWESLRSDLRRPVTGVRVGCSIFTDEIIRPPRAAVEARYGPLVSWREIPRGGHFPAAEVPDLLAAELHHFAESARSWFSRGVYDDYAPCAVCGSKVDLAGRDEPATPDDATEPVGPDGGVVGTADDPVDRRICSNPDCPTHREGGGTP